DLRAASFGARAQPEPGVRTARVGAPLERDAGRGKRVLVGQLVAAADHAIEEVAPLAAGHLAHRRLVAVLGNPNPWLAVPLPEVAHQVVERLRVSGAAAYLKVEQQ